MIKLPGNTSMTSWHLSPFLYSVPTTGPDKISRRIQHADTLKGSKKLHWYVDIGEEGKLLVRDRPCHLHERCMNLDKEYILTSCPSNDVCRGKN